MKRLVFVLMILASLTVDAQKCKFDYDKTDAFTGKQTIAKRATIGKAWKIDFYRSEETFWVGIDIVLAGITEDVINKGDTIMIALEGHEPICLSAIETALPVATANEYGVLSYYQAAYYADLDKITAISQYKTTAIRIFWGRLYKQVTIKPKDAKTITKAATCILNSQLIK